MRYKRMYFMILAYVLALIVAGLLFDDPANILPGLWKIVDTQDVLITDYVAIAGPGAAFVNSALVTLISAAIPVASSKVQAGPEKEEPQLLGSFPSFPSRQM